MKLNSIILHNTLIQHFIQLYLLVLYNVDMHDYISKY